VSADRRAAAVAETIKALGWCVTIPHTIDQVIGIYAERTRTTARPMRHGMTNDEILASITGHGGGSTSGHSDPTARAALWGEPEAVDDDETVATIRHAVDLCHRSAAEIAGICGTTTPAPADPTLTTTVATTISTVHRWAPQLEPIAAELHGDDLAHLDQLVRTDLAETATLLHDKAYGIWDMTRGEQLQVAMQRTIVACRVHERWVKNPPNAVGPKDLCARCTKFQERHRCEPTEPIVRRWEYGAEATPGQILEAKAAGRKAKRKAG